MTTDAPVTLDPIIGRLSKDLRTAAKTLSSDEARYLVDLYYQMQKARIGNGNRVHAMAGTAEPHQMFTHVSETNETLESHIKTALDVYSFNHPVGNWLRAQGGIGPVIAAGLLAHIDITKAPTVGHIWAFAGLDPTKKWNKGERRPWNAALKVLCWKMGESFTKVSGNENAYYGQVYKTRKEYETEKNLRGDYADQAAATIASKKFGDDTQALAHYKLGHLPPARIHLRAQRYAVKLLLSHLHDVWYRHEYGVAPPLPYAIAHLAHAHYLAPPTGM